MLVPIEPVEVDGVTCTAVSVSLAVSSSLALRAVPVDADGVEVDGHVLSIVFGADDPALEGLFDALSGLVGPLIEGRRAAGGFARVESAQIAVPPVSKDELDAQARQAMLDAAAALEAAKAAYEAAVTEPVVVADVKARG